VLFCDLVGSTAISGRVDPERLRELLRAYHAECGATVERFGGFVGQYLGDGIVAYFGYPRAHEDDAERAVRAGLGMLEAIERVDPPGPGIRLAGRVGIATGRVVTADATDGLPGSDLLMIGETPNLAARLQAVAPEGAVVVAPLTRSLLGGRFVCEDLGLRPLKGIAEPVRVWRVLRPDDSLSRFEAAHAGDLLPLVGRGEELDLLVRRWADAQAGRGQVVLLSGEAGIGKSRLAQALRERIPPDASALLRFQCSPHAANSTLHPILPALERFAGFEPADPAARRLERLDALATLAGQDPAATTPLLAALLSLPTGDRYPPLDLSPRRQRERTLAALAAVIAGLGGGRPLLALVEDAHWIDPTSQEVLDRLVEAAPATPLLLLVTARPGYWPPWTGQRHVGVCILTRLGREEAVEMVRRVAHGKALPPDVVDPIVARADGVPLFVEELTRAVLESPLLQETADGYRLRDPRRLPALPATLHDSLMARLDQAAPLKEVAQIASVIGRHFPYELLAAMAGLAEEALAEALDRLVAAGLIYRHGSSPRAPHSFKHALVQEAAYDSLLVTRRQALHHRLVDLLEGQAREGAPADRAEAMAEGRTDGRPDGLPDALPDILEVSPETLARHCAEAGLPGRAVGYWHAAGRRASERSAYREAIAHLTAGLETLATLPDNLARRRQELDLLITLGPVLINAKGPRTWEVAQSYSRALDLCSQLPESPQHFAALWGSWRISEHFHAKRERADALLALAERLDDPGLRLQAHHCLWASLFHLAQHAACCEHVERGLALYARGDYRAHSSVYAGHDPKVCGLGEQAFALWLLGYPDRSLRASRDALAWARHLGHSGTLVHALDMSLLLHRYRREAPVVRRQAEELIGYAGERGLPVHQAKGRVFLGWATAALGGPEAGTEEMRAGLEVQKAIGTREDFPILFEMLAEGHARAGRPRLALDVLDEALAETERSGLAYWTAELLRARSQVLLALHGAGAAEVEACARRALEVARAQGARALELRAALALARLEGLRDRPAAARELVGPVLAWFREGLDTADLREAHEFLADLAPGPPGAPAAAGEPARPRPATPAA
jgi:class 3 adenylate cyclase/predicted ATPase